MNPTKLIIEARREAYSTEYTEQTMTVAELREYLEQFDENLPVYLSHDNGYTYGAITEHRINEYYEDEE